MGGPRPADQPAAGFQGPPPRYYGDQETVARAIAWQASVWPADPIVLTRRPRPAITRLVWAGLSPQRK